MMPCKSCSGGTLEASVGKAPRLCGGRIRFFSNFEGMPNGEVRTGAPCCVVHGGRLGGMVEGGGITAWAREVGVTSAAAPNAAALEAKARLPGLLGSVGGFSSVMNWASVIYVLLINGTESLAALLS